jgi:hypothetical protein
MKCWRSQHNTNRSLGINYILLNIMNGQEKKTDTLQAISRTGNTSRKQSLIYQVEECKCNKCSGSLFFEIRKLVQPSRQYKQLRRHKYQRYFLFYGRYFECAECKPDNFAFLNDQDDDGIFWGRIRQKNKTIKTVIRMEEVSPMIWQEAQCTK